MSTTTTTAPLHKTAFHKFHVQHGAKLVDFAGWEMPLLYRSIIDEHAQVRTSGGLFDVSHMGRLRFTGRDARRFLDHVCTRQIHGMSDGAVRYSLICNHQGGCRDDVLVYRIAEAEYLMVCNASNREKLLKHFEEVKGDMVFKLKDETMSTAMVALQGPKVMELLANFSSEVPTLKRFRFTQKNVLIAKVLISRTGYTGEDGVEVIMPNLLAGQAISMMLKNVPGGLDAADAPIKPAGLGARDSLRMEAGMALYGHEIAEDIDPISAGLNFAVKLNKGEEDQEVGRFIGQDALQKIAEEGPKNKLVGLLLDGRRSARQGMDVLTAGEKKIGFVTSGCASPTLGRCIAMAFVDADASDIGTQVKVDLGRTTAEAQIVELPFYKAK